MIKAKIYSRRPKQKGHRNKNEKEIVTGRNHRFNKNISTAE